MKKFLTVLLVIAVMFTFSFGTAFAAFSPVTDAEGTYAARVAKAEAEVLKALDNTLATYGKASSGYIVGFTIESDTYDSLLPEVKEELLKAIDTKTTALLAGTGVTGSETVAQLTAKYTDGTNALSSVAAIDAVYATTKFVEKAVYAQFAVEQKKVLDKFETVDLNAFSNTTPANNPVTYYQAAYELLEGMKDTVKNAEIGALVNSTTVANAMNVINAEVAKVQPVQVNVGGSLVNTNVYEFTTAALANGIVVNGTTENIITKDDEAEGALGTAANKATLKALVATNNANYLNTTPNADKDLAATYVSAYNFLIDEEVITTTGQIAAVSVFAPGAAYGHLMENDKLIDELNTFAATYKLEKDANGDLVRDAADVDEIVRLAKIDAYTHADALWAGLADAKTAIVNATKDAGAVNLAFVKEVAKAAVADARDEAADNYYPLELEKVNAKYDALVAAIEAATTEDAVRVQYAKIATAEAGIADMDDVDALFAAGGKLDAEFVKQMTAATNYLAYLNNGLTSKDAAYRNPATLRTALVEMFGENGARTVAEMKALADKAKEVVEALPTSGTIAAAKTELETAIKAVPKAANVTLADDAAIKKAFALMSDYMDLTGAATMDATDIANAKVLKDAINPLYNATMLDLAKKLKAVDTTDKEALKALKAEIKAFNDLCKAGEEEIFDGKTKFDVVGGNNVALDKINGALAKIRDAELKAVKDAITAIPVNPSIENKAAIEAARKLYDAFVAEYTVYDGFNDYNAAAAVTNFRELALAEATIEVMSEDDAIAAVEGIKLTASSTAKKGSITVKWTVTGDAAAADGFQVWKSTKMNSGFKKAFTTTKTSYKNTKGLKKGTRYYYKVRAYKVVDGKNVYSDWSNKAYRVAK